LDKVFLPVLRNILGNFKFYGKFREEKGDISATGECEGQSFETALDSSEKTAKKLGFYNPTFLFYYSRLGSHAHTEHALVLLTHV